MIHPYISLFKLHNYLVKSVHICSINQSGGLDCLPLLVVPDIIVSLEVSETGRGSSSGSQLFTVDAATDIRIKRFLFLRYFPSAV